MKIVLDTNCLLPAVIRHSAHRWLWDAFRRQCFVLCCTTEILNEYEKLLTAQYTPAFVVMMMSEILIAPNVLPADVYFNWHLISTDPDDNKFVDCAISSGADYIVSNDKHFSVLKNVDFPKLNVLNILEFKGIIL